MFFLKVINYMNSLIRCWRTNERDVSVLRVISVTITSNVILVCCLYVTLAISESVSSSASFTNNIQLYS